MSSNKTPEFTIPPVAPLTQIEKNTDGTTRFKKVKPITYALISFVKNILKERDIININDDETEGEWTCNYSYEEEGNFDIFINTYDDHEFITLDMYSAEIDTETIDNNLLNEFILEQNMGLRIGQLQHLNGTIRFHTSLDVSNMASKDPKYTGPHLVDPKLIANIFNYAIYIFPKILKNYTKKFR